MIFDTHAHYDDEAFDPDREELLSSLPSRGIGTVVNVCASPESLDTTPALAHRFPWLYAAVGLHPDDAGAYDEAAASKIRSLASDPKTVAIGEIGLDYYWHKEETEHQLQKEVFCAQLQIARETAKPFIVHSREAAKDTLELVREFVRQGMYGGTIHCFSYSWEIARQYLDMGLYLGIGGVLTYKNARKLVEVAEKTPLSQILLETDCPYLSPVPNRGKRNSSLNLPRVVEALARLKGVGEDTVIAVTEENARRLFQLPEGSGVKS